MERNIDRLRRQETTEIKPLEQKLYRDALERLTNRLRAHGIKLESTKIMVLSGSIPRMEQRSLRLNPTTQKMELQIIRPQQKSLGQTDEGDDEFDPDVAPRKGDDLTKTASDALKKEWAKQPLVP